MSNRGSHTGKSPKERNLYSQYIRKMDYEPTVDETIALSPSDQGGEELKEPTSKRKRKIKTGQKIKTHFEQHWVEWLFAVGLTILAWLMVDAKVNIARMDSTLDAQKDNITGLKQDTKGLGVKNQDQDLMLMEHSIRLSNIENQANRNRK